MMLWLIPRYGIYGAAVSLLASTVTRLLFIYIGFSAFLKTRPPRLLPGVHDLKLLLHTTLSLRAERVA
jgi:O-antigen/teichoic acid export membrane protein